MAKPKKQLTDNPVVLRILNLIEEKGKREIDLAAYLGVTPGTISKWKYEGSYVYTKYINEICEYLDTTPNYLFFGPEDEDERLTPEEKKLIKTYRSFDERRKACVRATFEFFKESNKRKKK